LSDIKLGGALTNAGSSTNLTDDDVNNAGSIINETTGTWSMRAR
jgi:hypothetical protein